MGSSSWVFLLCSKKEQKDSRSWDPSLSSSWLSLAYMAYWCKYQEGREKCIGCMEDRERKRVAIQELPDDMEFLKARVAALTDHTGMVVEDDEEEKDVEKEAAEEEVAA